MKYHVKIIVDPWYWCGDSSIRAYKADLIIARGKLEVTLRKLAEFISSRWKDALVYSFIFIGSAATFMVAVFLVWSFLTGKQNLSNISASNSYFTLLTFATLLGSIIIQGISVHKQIAEMKIVADAQIQSTNALQRQILLMQLTSTLQVAAAEVNALESDERYKIMKRQDGTDVHPESDTYLIASADMREQIREIRKSIEVLDDKFGLKAFLKDEIG